MTREQAKQKLIDLGITEPTDKQISDLLDSVTAETKAANDKAKTLKEQADKAADLQKQLDEINQKGLSELEKANQTNAALQKQVAEMQANSFKSEAKAILAKAGLEDADVETLLPGMVAGLEKLEDVQARANAYVGTVNKIRDKTIKDQEKAALDSTQTPGGGKPAEDKKSEAELFAEGMVKANSSDAKGADAILSNYK